MEHVLSKGEVDALLRGVSDGQIETETDIPEEVGGVVPYDLTSQDKIVRGRLPTLDIVNQMFSRLFRNSFSSLMRKSADISTVSTDSLKFGEFLRSLSVPSSLHVFRMEPLRGFGLMVIESRLVFSFVDNFFGGTGASDVNIMGRDFSAIETRMTKKVVLNALEDWERAWKSVHPVACTYVRSEVNPQFAAIVPPTDVVLVIVFDIEMENSSGTATICIPYSMIEPIINKLKANFQSEQMEVDQVWVNRLRGELMKTEVEMVAELGQAQITPRELLGLQKGNVLMLGRDVSDPLYIKTEGTAKFRGYSGVSRGMKAIQITEVLQ
ncbi:MAG: flagellar motor switch protein FliM [Nitrospinota bacterium]|jgi:flagellar motor switch protein FliM|nr:flagellar motor switch protein FliM [Nitrospinota bacterium]